MASRSAITQYAYWLIAREESSFSWDSVHNPTEGFTLGILQWYCRYGRAGNLLRRFNDSNALAEQFRTSCPNIYRDSRSTAMEHYGYRAYEPEFPALARLLDSESGRRVQWNVGNEDLDTYINDFEPNNMAQVNAQMMVYFMLMHHQSPQSSYDVMETAAIGFGNNWDIVTLDAVHVYCGRNPVFAPFMGSRYNPAYTTLQSWNGASPPPNFGQPGGGSEPEPPPTELSSIIKYVQRVGNDLVIHAADGSISALYCGYMGNGNYLPRAN